MCIIVPVSFLGFFLRIFFPIFLSINSLVWGMLSITYRSDTRMITLQWRSPLYRLHVFTAVHYRLALPYTEFLHRFVQLK